MATTVPATVPAQGIREIQDAGRVDALIVGAGVSGIGAAHHLRDPLPDRTLVILDAQDVTGRGITINGLPNMAYVFGYFRHSWPLRVDLASDLVCRPAVTHARRGRHDGGPHPATQDQDMQLRPFSENFNPGYVMRSQHILFKQGDREP